MLESEHEEEVALFRLWLANFFGSETHPLPQCPALFASLNARSRKCPTAWREADRAFDSVNNAGH